MLGKDGVTLSGAYEVPCDKEESPAYEGRALRKCGRLFSLGRLTRLTEALVGVLRKFSVTDRTVGGERRFYPVFAISAEFKSLLT